MTSHPPASDTEPRPPYTDRSAKPADTGQASGNIPWSEPDLHVEPSRLDAEIAVAAKALFFAPDLIRPGPGLLPFGAKARGRRERRHQVDMIAATRRAELGRLLNARRNSRIEPSTGAARRGHPHLVAAVLGALVIMVAIAGWWMSPTTTTAAPPRPPTDTVSVATDLPLYEPDPTAPDITGVPTASPGPGVDLTTPEAAATSWLSAWCPADETRDPAAVAAGIRAMMTADGWAQFTATPGQTVDAAPGTTASCDTPTTRVMARPPDSNDTVMVLVSATRTIIDPDPESENARAAKHFRIERLQYVVRGNDGVWRVDVAAVGG